MKCSSHLLYRIPIETQSTTVLVHVVIAATLCPQPSDYPSISPAYLVNMFINTHSLYYVYYYYCHPSSIPIPVNIQQSKSIDFP